MPVMDPAMSNLTFFTLNTDIQRRKIGQQADFTIIFRYGSNQLSEITINLTIFSLKNQKVRFHVKIVKKRQKFRILPSKSEISNFARGRLKMCDSRIALSFLCSV